MIIKNKIPVYGGILSVCIGNDFFELGQELRLTFDKSDLGECNALSIEINYLQYAIFLSEETIHAPGVIAHEAKHIVNYIFANRGVRLDVKNDEPECYFLKTIVELIYSSIQKDNKKNA